MTPTNQHPQTCTHTPVDGFALIPIRCRVGYPTAGVGMIIELHMCQHERASLKRNIDGKHQTIIVAFKVNVVDFQSPRMWPG